MSTACAQGAQSKLYVEPGDAPHTFDSSSERYEFLYETMQAIRPVIYSDGIRGTRSQHASRSRYGNTVVGGRLAMNISKQELDLWLPRILGASESSDVFNVAESLPSFGMLFDKVTQRYQYTGCKVNRAIFRGGVRPNGDTELIEMLLEIIGLEEIAGTSAPSVALSTYAPYVYHDSILTIDGTAREVKQWAIAIDNRVRPRWVNSENAVRVCPGDRVVSVQAVVPFDAATLDLHALNDVTGLAGSLALADGTNTTTFSFAKLQFIKETPTVRGKTEIDLKLGMIARRTDAAAEIIVTNAVD